MVQIPNLPFAGIVNSKRVGIYKLDPTLTTPIQPIYLDLLPLTIPSPYAVQMDVAEAITRHTRYTVTENQVLGFRTITNNAHKELQRASVSGILDPRPLGVGGGVAEQALINPPSFGIFRKDLIVKDILYRLADERKPMLVITPDWVMSKAFIEGITETQNAGDGEVTRLQIEFVEARVIIPFVGDALDAAAMTGGATQNVNAGPSGPVEGVPSPELAAGGLG
jgi:hypothetical protein